MAEKWHLLLQTIQLTAHSYSSTCKTSVCR